MNIEEVASKYAGYQVEIRRHFHRHPEVSGKEYETSKMVKAELDKIGVEWVPCGLETGVLATIKGEKPGKTILLRGDMDALTVDEQTGAPYASENPGVMHACGHDCHTSMLLTAAHILNDMKSELCGTVKLAFQPAEEIAEGAKLTRRSAAKILAGIRPYTFAMFKNNPEEFITKAIRLINEQKATMIVEQITYNQTDGTYDSSIFTAEKNTDFSKAYHAKKNVQDYVFADGYAKDGQSIERQFAESMDLADEVCVYAKLPKGFSIPTPVGNYSPDWAIAFHKGTVKHIYFIAETKGTMETLNLKPIEKAKIDCVKKLFRNLSSADVVYDSVDSFQHLLDIMDKL